jgi:hypothetical protein
MFDSSAHDRLVKIDDVAADPIYAAINTKYFFRLPGLAREEIVSTPPTAIGMALLEGCRKLTSAERKWDCVYPPYEALRMYIASHANDPSRFDWLTVDVRWPELAYEIRSGDFTADDKLAEEQRLQQNASIKEYKAIWVSLRAKLDPIFAVKGIPRPGTFSQLFADASASMLPGRPPRRHSAPSGTLRTGRVGRKMKWFRCLHPAQLC